ncbi:uncharacterized protein LOC142171990 [Nicotiana tabacum]|uniref:Uncharacterized protein LOC142171990 n=1 Tax=Nicotiana tabacum TaxID=4097 RepID=A0AC58T3R7_TOBAC
MATADNTEPEKLNHNHPLFLNSNDNSGVILISLQLRGPKNYSVWSLAKRIVILGRNKLSFIDDTCKRENYSTNLVDLWERYNAIVLSWLMNCVSPELLSEMVYSSNASAVLDDLKEYFDKAQSQLLMMVSVPSVNKVYSMLMERESQKTMKNAYANLNAGEMAALLTNRIGNQQKPKKNYNVYCDYCKLKGLTRDTCYKLVGYPNDHKFKKKYNSQGTTKLVTQQPTPTTFTSTPTAPTFTP